jgi:signal peptidase I
MDTSPAAPDDPKKSTVITPPKNTPSGSSQSTRHEVLSTLGIFAAAALVAVFIILFVFRSYQVDGPSMQNTLHNGDKLIIWKVPRTWADITHHAYIPKRGDIVVFNESGLSQYGQQDSKQLIKRVIGLPGDHIIIKNGAITIYNKEHPNGFDPDKTLPYGKNGAIPYTSGNINVTLGPNQLFMCGDNRPDSLDSRIFGPIQAKQIVGKLALRVLPINQAETF